MKKKNIAPKASVAERIIRCPKCGNKLAEAKNGAHCRGVTIWCKRCRTVIEVEL